VRGARLEIRAGGAPSPPQLAAVAAAVTALLEEERAGEDAEPPAYASAWRRAAIREAVGLGGPP
jgi:hypothetical protein